MESQPKLKPIIVSGQAREEALADIARVNADTLNVDREVLQTRIDAFEAMPIEEATEEARETLTEDVIAFRKKRQMAINAGIIRDVPVRKPKPVSGVRNSRKAVRQKMAKQSRKRNRR